MANHHNKTNLFVEKQPGGRFLVTDQGITTGDIFFVDSTTGTDRITAGKSPETPFATLDYAVDYCTASQGDIIYLMPGHAETGSTASQELFDLDVAGISVIGLGVGDKRPTFTLTEATVTCVIGAANCRLSNVRIVGNIADLATGLEIEAAAVGTRVDNCYFGDTAAATDMLVVVAIEANADRLIFEDNHVNCAVGGEATECLAFAGGCDSLILRRNIMVGDWKTGGAIEMSTAASTNILIYENTVSNSDGTSGLAYNGHASSTGGIFKNYLHGDKNGTSPTATMDGLWTGETYGGDEPATSGIIQGAAATAWS
jgi:hypothetical protein